MFIFTEQQFTIPSIQGISAKNIEEHLKLYAGYVKNTNTVLAKIADYSKDDTHTYEIGELYRRFSFEFNGMRNHEYYFKLLEKPVLYTPDSLLVKAIEAQWGSIDAWKESFIQLALTRGVGWAMLSWAPVTKQLLMHWVDEQHLGQLQGTFPIIALDMWEHAYVADYFSSGKKQYIIDFLSQMNWHAAETNFEIATHIG